MKVEIAGLDKLQREMKEIERAVQALNGEIANISYDPKDQMSIDKAVREMKLAVDRKTARYKGNPLVRSLADATKKDFEKRIRSDARK